MTYWEALGWAGAGLGGVILFIGLVGWTVWLYPIIERKGLWLQRALNLVVWVLLLTSLIWVVANRGPA